MRSQRYLYDVKAALALVTLLAGCSGIISDEPVKTQAPSARSSPKKDTLFQSKKKKMQKVALLLPLSGEEAALGQSLKKAAELSLFDNGPQNLEILFQDTHSTPEGASSAAQSALKQGAKLLLGPVFAPEVRSVASVAQTWRVPVISFSSDQSLGKKGVYAIGFSPREQVQRIVLFAHSKGIQRLAVLAPETPYGALVKKEVHTLAAKGKTTLVLSLTYTGLGENLDKDMEKLNNGKFEGLLLPVGGEDLKILLANLQAFGFDFSRVQLLGTGLWDTRPTLENPLLEGAWFSSVDPLRHLAFEDRFQNYYHKKPPRIATLAYDAVALVATLTQKSGTSTAFSPEALTRSDGFKGVDGLLFLKPQGETQRDLAVLENTPQGSDVVSSAIPNPRLNQTHDF